MQDKVLGSEMSMLKGTMTKRTPTCHVRHRLRHDVVATAVKETNRPIGTNHAGGGA